MHRLWSFSSLINLDNLNHEFFFNITTISSKFGSQEGCIYSVRWAKGFKMVVIRNEAIWDLNVLIFLFSLVKPMMW